MTLVVGLCCLCLGMHIVQAEELSGRVFDHLGRGLSGATVTVANGDEVASDADGFFYLSTADEVSSLTITASGFTARNFTFSGSQRLERHYTLFPVGVTPPAAVTVRTSMAERDHRIVNERSSAEFFGSLGGARPTEQYNRFSSTREDRNAYTEVSLDNGLVEVIVAPSLGARLARVIDKTGDVNRDLFMRIDDPIAGIGNAAWQDLGGVEPSFPFHEAGTGMEIDPAGWYVDQHPDGSALVVMHLRQDHHQRPADLGFQGKFGDMPLTVIVALRPGESRVRYQMVAENANPTRRPDRMWSDVLFPREAGLEILFPAKYHGDHGFKGADPLLSTFPFSDSRTAPNKISKFALAPHYGFAGGWYPNADANHLRYADPKRFPGMKLYYDEGQPNFFELWGSTNQVFEAAEGWVDPWSPLELEQWFAMAQGIGRCDFANEYIAFGADGQQVHMVSHQPGTVTIFEQGGNSVLAGPQVMAPGTVLSATFSDGVRIEIDGVVVADEALVDDPYEPIDLDFPPSSDVPFVQADWESLYADVRELNRLVRGFSGEGAVDATGSDAAYEAQHIASKTAEVSLAGVLKTSNATRDAMSAEQLISAARACYRLGFFDEVDDFMGRLSATTDADILAEIDELKSLMAEEDPSYEPTLDLASLASTRALWARTMEALRNEDQAAALVHLGALISTYPSAVQPRLLRARLNADLSEALTCWRLQPGSPLVLRTIEDLGYTEVSGLLSDLSAASPFVGYAIQRHLALKDGAWQHERRLEWESDWVNSGSLPQFPAALKYDYSAVITTPTISVSAAPSSDRESVILTATTNTFTIPTKEVIFKQDGSFLARDVFKDHDISVALDGMVTPVAHTVTVETVLGSAATATLGETAPFPRDDAVATLMNIPVSVDVLDNDVDLQGDAISLANPQPSQSGGHTLTVQGSSLLVTPATGFTGLVDLPYLVEDDDGTRQAYIKLEVLESSENDRPVAEDVLLFTASGEPVTIRPEYTDLISGGGYDLVVLESPDHGVVSGTGVSRTYTPNNAFQGTDQFRVAISDGDKQSRPVLVTVVVAEPYIAGSEPIVIEAEDYHLNIPGSGSFSGQSYELRTSRSGYRQLGYMEVDATPVDNTAISGKPRLDYKVYFPSAGDYGVRVRLYNVDSEWQNRVHVLLNDVQLTGSGGISRFGSSEFKWAPGGSSVVTLSIPSPGVHTVSLVMLRARTPLDALVIDDSTSISDPGSSAAPSWPVAHLPQAQDDVVSVAHGKTRLLKAPGVLENDSGQQISASLLGSDASLGSVELDSNGQLTIESDENVALGAHWIDYLVTDENGLEAIGRVRVEVQNGIRDILIRLQGTALTNHLIDLELNGGEANKSTDETGSAEFTGRLPDRDQVIRIGEALPLGDG